jgi:hypothetical protein
MEMPMQFERRSAMKKLYLLLLSASLLIGCAKGPTMNSTGAIGTRTDVFTEEADEGSVPQGFADLLITSSLKTHGPLSYSACEIHGTADYRFMVNIDGQATSLSVRLKEENLEPRGVRDPEAGEGMRYSFSKRVRLRPGAHRVIFDVPEDNISVVVDISLDEERLNRLVLEPIYGVCLEKQRPGYHGVTNFHEGLKGFRVILNGVPIKDS